MWRYYGLAPFAWPVSFFDDASTASFLTAVDDTNPAHARLAGLLRATNGDLARRERDIRRAFRLRQPFGRVLLTGYYVPRIDASQTPGGAYRYPIHARPADLAPGVPYLTRAEIDAGALAGRDLEIAWARDPVDLFLMHVQGSGRARLPDGRTIGLLFAATNHRPYTSLGRIMVERGLVTIERSTIADLRAALAALGPDERLALLRMNDRYTFFRRDDGPAIGASGVPLTPGRSLATDPDLIPPGALLYLETPSYRRFVVAQDTGAAITEGRADLFLGEGSQAGAVAGRLRDRGRLWILEPR